jgi:hypothetical protein
MQTILRHAWRVAIDPIIGLCSKPRENMSQTVADPMWAMLVNAEAKRCYGIVGDALNPGTQRHQCQGESL